VAELAERQSTYNKHYHPKRRGLCGKFHVAGGKVKAGGHHHDSQPGCNICTIC
jgi:hypothetical protein